MSEIFNCDPGDDVEVPPGLTAEEAYRFRLLVRLSRATAARKGLRASAESTPEPKGPFDTAAAYAVILAWCFDNAEAADSVFREAERFIQAALERDASLRAEEAREQEERAAERDAAARTTREAIAESDRRAAELAQLNSVSVFGTKH